MNRPSQIIVLAEDDNQLRLINRHLRKRGYTHHQIRRVKCGGLTRLYEEFPTEVEAFRQVLSRRSGALLIVADADDLTVAERIAILDAKLAEASHPARQRDEPIFFVVPRRNIETWIFYLTGNAVDEGSDYKPRCTPSTVDEAAPIFAARTWPRQAQPDDTPPSFLAACEELWRLP
jgi:hypothetical protein